MPVQKIISEKKLYYMVGDPTFINLKMMIRWKVIHDFQLMVEYIEIEEMLFGPDLFTLKEIKTIGRPKVVVDDFIEIAIELIIHNQELILCMKKMFINQHALFATLDKYKRFH